MNTKEPITHVPVLAQLREMKIGDALVFPIEKRSSVKTTMSTFALQWNKIFGGRTDRENRKFIVTRVA